jgi:hypothetical protein
MRVFISKYELRSITFKEHEVHDSDKKLLHSRKESCDITNKYGIKLKYMLLY